MNTIVMVGIMGSILIYLFGMNSRLQYLIKSITAFEKNCFEFYLCEGMLVTGITMAQKKNGPEDGINMEKKIKMSKASTNYFGTILVKKIPSREEIQIEAQLGVRRHTCIIEKNRIISWTDR